jgi:hypothetical protein
VPANIQQEEAENEDDGLGAYNVLRTLATVLESVSSQPSLFAEVSCRSGMAAQFQLFVHAPVPRGMLPPAVFGLHSALIPMHAHSPADLSSLLLQLEGILFPIMQRMITQDGQDVFEEVRSGHTFIWRALCCHQCSSCMFGLECIRLCDITSS